MFGSISILQRDGTSTETPGRAQFICQRAIEVAHEARSLNWAGLAALTMIEEITTLPHEGIVRLTAEEVIRRFPAAYSYRLSAENSVHNNH